MRVYRMGLDPGWKSPGSADSPCLRGKDDWKECRRGECVDETSLNPDEIKVTIQQKTPGMVSPALAYRVVAGALYSSLGQQLAPLLQREYRPQRQGRYRCDSPVP